MTVPEKFERLSIAAPPLTGATPSTVLPLRKLMVPVGVPAPGATTATVAVSVALDPFCTRARPVTVLALLITKFGELLFAMKRF